VHIQKIRVGEIFLPDNPETSMAAPFPWRRPHAARGIAVRLGHDCRVAVLGPTSDVGDYLHGLLVVPGTTAAAVSIQDGSLGEIIVFMGSGTLSDLKPFFIPITAKSVNGAWKVTPAADNTAACGSDW
jgi:hypothetical protein